MRQLIRSCFVLVCFLSLGSSGIFAQQEAVPVLEICIAQAEPADGWEKIEVDGKAPIFVDPKPVIREGDIESVEVREDGSGKGIFIRLSKRAGIKMFAASRSNLKKQMAIMFKGEFVAAPSIQDEIGREVMISGNFGDAQIEEMLVALQPRSDAVKFDADDLEKLSARLDKALDNRIFSGTVLIAVDGEIVFEKSAGYANSEEESPLGQDSSFRLASVSKQFTAMGIMLLKEEGKLDFDDDITKHLPTLPYKGVTIRQLLHHTGGLTDYMGLFDKHWDTDKDAESKKTAFNQDLVDLFSKHKPDPDFEPGQRYEYSNTGYVLLGSIIEKVSGQRIQKFYKERIFGPLGMKDSFAFSVDESEFNPKNRVFGFAFETEGYSENDWNYLNGMIGDGGVYATARDLLKWDQALYGEKLVSKSTLDEAFTSGKLNSGKETGYGFGWAVERSKEDGLTVSHGGSWVGFRTSIERQVDRKVTVIVLSNNSTMHLDKVLQAIDKL